MENLTPEQVIEKFNTIISEKTVNSVNKTELESLKKEMTEMIQKNDNSDLKTALAKLEGMVEGMKESKIVGEGTFKNIGDAIFKAYSDNLDKIKEKSTSSGVLDLDVKVAGTMTINGNYSGGVIALTELEQGVTRIVRRVPFLRQIVNAGVTLSKYITYIEQANPDPNEAGMTAEGALKTQQDFDLVERQAVTQKITAFIKVSKEMIQDLPFMQKEINTELMELVALKLDSQILSGDGIGNNLIGILQNAVTFSATGFALSIPFANELDVLRVAIQQVESALFQVNYIIMHPTDIAKFDVTKTSTGEYTMPMIYTDLNGVKRYNGIEIISNTGIAVGTFLLGDFTKSNLRIREDMNIQVGSVNDDFTKNLVTILCEARATHYVKTNHYGAFVKGTFATAKSALLKP